MLLLLLIIFFFFKQKTAYEMLRSLVGSEMCIRDRSQPPATTAMGPSSRIPIPFTPPIPHTFATGNAAALLSCTLHTHTCSAVLTTSFSSPPGNTVRSCAPIAPGSTELLAISIPLPCSWYSATIASPPLLCIPMSVSYTHPTLPTQRIDAGLRVRLAR
eukprot:TRINITY_DN38340_c0_g1_i1.p1 TRINITY_DN38340_c0_g1~~TRINITY_DN38340_c0_g1_i1.p1  ORF type:complete len:159 (-),score=38.31 TRINITY_DN38340_c0_g1_i1:46-522(-)